MRTDIRWYMYANYIKDNDLPRVLEATAWDELFADLDRLAEGFLPDGSVAYEEDGNKWGFVFVFAQGDLEQLVIQYGLVSYNAADEICGWCRCNRSSRPYTNLLDTAEWKPTTKFSNQDDVSETRVLPTNTNGLILNEPLKRF